MAIRVGTIVTRYDAYTGHIPCLDHATYESDHDPILDVCVGMVVDMDYPDTSVEGNKWKATINWLQMCPYARNEGTLAQEIVDADDLWEIGQLA